MVNFIDDLTDDFTNNPEPRCACVLVVDVSGSMVTCIAELNEGLVHLKECIADDSVASLRTEIAVVAYNAESRLAHDFATVGNFDPPILSAGGGTKISSGINLALDLAEERKRVYKENGVTYYRPWVWLLCDGYAEHDTPDEWQMAKDRVKQAEADKQVAFFVVGVGDGANMQALNEIGSREALRLKSLNFREMFDWLSKSLASTSYSLVTDEVMLTNPAGWGTASGS